MDTVLKGMTEKRADLLRVLDRPEVPLHNNLSEGHMRGTTSRNGRSAAAHGVSRGVERETRSQV